MRNQMLKAAGLGHKSHESEKGVVLSPRLQLDFDCPARHHFSVVFAADAALPSSWDCPVCWTVSTRSDGTLVDVSAPKHVRTHWEMLRERRSLPELETLLAERLALLRAGGIGPGAPRPLNPRTRHAV